MLTSFAICIEVEKVDLKSKNIECEDPSTNLKLKRFNVRRLCLQNIFVRIHTQAQTL